MKYNIRNMIFKDGIEAESKGRLGIYIRKDSATVACTGLQGEVLSFFSVSNKEQQEQNPQALVTLISQGCVERQLEFSEVAVALDCAMFMQHDINSDFTDQKQIAATIRFDTEEALAKDVTDVAMAFNIVSSDQNGSQLSVFTAQQKMLSDILLALQSNNVDPVTVEPDVNCLSEFIFQNVIESRQSGTLFGVLSHSSGYLIVPPSSTELAAKVRTFLIGPNQDRNALLAREVLMTLASSQTGEPISCLRFFSSTGSVDGQQLSSKLGMKVEEIDLLDSVKADNRALDDCNVPVELVIAYAAAAAYPEKTQSINFRNDFMPYQGKKILFQKTLKVASYSVTILMLAIGLYLQTSLWKINRSRSAARKKFAKDYSAVMMEEMPKKPGPVTKLKGTLTRVRKASSGLSLDESISSKLILVFQAFNSCAENTDLNIDSVTVTDRNINILGDTSSKGNTLKLFEAIKKVGLEIQQQRLYTKDKRDKFVITVGPKKL